jgi:dihydropteroate synthase
MLIDSPLDRYFIKKKTIRYNGELVDLSTPMVMGILNVTPDSFFDGGKYLSVQDALDQSVCIVNEGASIIDVGAYSTRPGAAEISVEEELNRLLPVITQLRKTFPSIIISIDTFRAEVAEIVIDKIGDCIINDVSGGLLDDKMFETVARLKVPYILMHMKGTPQNMQLNPTYENVTKEVIKSLSERVYKLHELGVSDVIIDPGFGFAKTLDHNYDLFNHLEAFRFFELPLLVGVSRKSMIYNFLKQTPDMSLNGTTVLNTLALQYGADILRVHDVKPAVEAVKITQHLKRFSK